MSMDAIRDEIIAGRDHVTTFSSHVPAGYGENSNISAAMSSRKPAKSLGIFDTNPFCGQEIANRTDIPETPSTGAKLFPKQFEVNQKGARPLHKCEPDRDTTTRNAGDDGNVVVTVQGSVRGTLLVSKPPGCLTSLAMNEKVSGKSLLEELSIDSLNSSNPKKKIHQLDEHAQSASCRSKHADVDEAPSTKLQDNHHTFTLCNESIVQTISPSKRIFGHGHVMSGPDSPNGGVGLKRKHDSVPRVDNNLEKLEKKPKHSFSLKGNCGDLDIIGGPGGPALHARDICAESVIGQRTGVTAAVENPHRGAVSHKIVASEMKQSSMLPQPPHDDSHFGTASAFNEDNEDRSCRGGLISHKTGSSSKTALSAENMLATDANVKQERIQQDTTQVVVDAEGSDVIPTKEEEVISVLLTSSPQRVTIKSYLNSPLPDHPVSREEHAPTASKSSPTSASDGIETHQADLLLLSRGSPRENGASKNHELGGDRIENRSGSISPIKTARLNDLKLQTSTNSIDSDKHNSPKQTSDLNAKLSAVVNVRKLDFIEHQESRHHLKNSPYQTEIGADAITSTLQPANCRTRSGSKRDLMGIQKETVVLTMIDLMRSVISDEPPKGISRLDVLKSKSPMDEIARRGLLVSKYSVADLDTWKLRFAEISSADCDSRKKAMILDLLTCCENVEIGVNDGRVELADVQPLFDIMVQPDIAVYLRSMVTVSANDYCISRMLRVLRIITDLHERSDFAIPYCLTGRVNYETAESVLAAFSETCTALGKGPYRKELREIAFKMARKQRSNPKILPVPKSVKRNSVAEGVATKHVHVVSAPSKAATYREPVDVIDAGLDFRVPKLKVSSAHGTDRNAGEAPVTNRLQSSRSPSLKDTASSKLLQTSRTGLPIFPQSRTKVSKSGVDGKMVASTHAVVQSLMRSMHSPGHGAVKCFGDLEKKVYKPPKPGEQPQSIYAPHSRAKRGRKKRVSFKKAISSRHNSDVVTEIVQIEHKDEVPFRDFGYPLATDVEDDFADAVARRAEQIPRRVFIGLMAYARASIIGKVEVTRGNALQPLDAYQAPFPQPPRE